MTEILAYLKPVLEIDVQTQVKEGISNAAFQIWKGHPSL